jgi:hypothetical protein
MFTPAASVGGFCVDPGDCICRSGYFGDLCMENGKQKLGKLYNSLLLIRKVSLK